MITLWMYWANFWLAVMAEPPVIIVPSPPPKPPGTVTDLGQWRRDHPPRPPTDRRAA
jgi:hypothetical protein